MWIAAVTSSGLRAYAQTIALSLALLGAVAGLAYTVGTHGQETALPAAVWNYQHALNPATNGRMTGPYASEDLYRNGNSFPLPGHAQVRS